jgi:hypothetical protein
MTSDITLFLNICVLCYIFIIYNDIKFAYEKFKVVW